VRAGPVLPLACPRAFHHFPAAPQRAQTVPKVRLWGKREGRRGASPSGWDKTRRRFSSTNNAKANAAKAEKWDCIFAPSKTSPFGPNFRPNQPLEGAT